MTYTAARCPRCGGDLQLDSAIETGFCMHCGSKIVVQDAIRAVRIDNTHMIDTWKRMGKSALDGKNYEEANNYFTKIVESEPDDWQAIFYKAYSAGLSSTLNHPRIAEFILGLQTANRQLENSKLPQDEIILSKNLFPPAIIEVTNTYLKLVDKKKLESKFGWRDEEVMAEIRGNYEKAIENYQLVLKMFDGYTDEISKSNIINIMKEIVELCAKVCYPMLYYRDEAKEVEVFAFGYTAHQKEKYINLYDDLVVEIRSIIPNYRTGENDSIDRLSMPPEIIPTYEIVYDAPDDMAKILNHANKVIAYMDPINRHFDGVILAEKSAEKVRKQKIYWKNHPEEYKLFLEEEKRRNEEFNYKKNMILQQINDKSKQVSEMRSKMENETSNLLKERAKLGIFAGHEKKLINERISSLNKEYLRLSEEYRNLKKSLEDLEKSTQKV